MSFRLDSDKITDATSTERDKDVDPVVKKPRFLAPLAGSGPRVTAPPTTSSARVTAPSETNSARVIAPVEVKRTGFSAPVQSKKIDNKSAGDTEDAG